MVSLLGLLFNVEMPDYKAIFFNEILWVASAQQYICYTI